MKRYNLVQKTDQDARGLNDLWGHRLDLMLDAFEERK